MSNIRNRLTALEERINTQDFVYQRVRAETLEALERNS